jgi:DNA-binding Xre family transcriptional regulator
MLKSNHINRSKNSNLAPKTKIAKYMADRKITYSQLRDKIWILCRSERYAKEINDPALCDMVNDIITGLRTGRRKWQNIKMATAVKICNALGCTLNDIIPNPTNKDGSWDYTPNINEYKNRI